LQKPWAFRLAAASGITAGLYIGVLSKTCGRLIAQS
jgi:hypothetical protein